MSWPSTSTQIQVGDEMCASDRDKVGAISAVQPTCLVVEKGYGLVCCHVLQRGP